MLVLGVSSLTHDSAAAVLRDDRLTAAVEEDKLSRASTNGGVPERSIQFCLGTEGATLGDVELVGVASRSRRAWRREQRLRARLGTPPGESPKPERRRNGHPPTDPIADLAYVFGGGGTPGLVEFEHHLCHAASAFFASDCDRALVLTLDGGGDMWSGLLAVGEGARIRVLRGLRFPDSLGWLYSRVTELLGFRVRQEHKTQWLSTHGQPDLGHVVRRVFTTDGHGLPRLDRSFLGQRVGDTWMLSPRFESELGLPQGVAGARWPERATLAASLQAFVEDTVVSLAERYRLATGASCLCLAGGVFLNGLLARALEERTGFDHVFVQPASGNAGTALGAAYLASLRCNGGRRPAGLCDVHLGPGYDPMAIKAVLDNCKLIYRYQPDEHQLLAETSRLLSDHHTVAWHQGRTEFGLRALGNRSVLASPFSPYVIDNLNQFIKHREDFHPFVLSVPSERAADFFDATANCRFAASVARLRSTDSWLRPFALSGGRVRLHVVDRASNPRFHSLLIRFGQTAPAPVLVNTSFNLCGEPLVADPRTAVRTVYCCGIDAMVIGDFLLTK